MQSQRNQTVDIAKGIAIILMCIGHARCPIMLHDFIYMFHMPFFFVVSGYFFSIKSVDYPWLFLKKKIKGLYLPFVKWGIFFVLCHNLFMDVGLLSSSNMYYTWKDMLWRGLTTNTRFIPTEPMMGPYWFLSCLFYSCMYCFVLFYVAKKINLSHKVLTFIFVGTYLLGFILLEHSREQMVLVCGFLYYLGYLIRLCKSKIKCNVNFLLLGGFAMLFVELILGYDSIAIPDGKYENPFLFIIYSLAGFVMLLSLAYQINRNRWLASLFSYIGRKTLIILLMNLLAVALMDLLRNSIYSDHIVSFTDIPAPFADNYWWIIYTIWMVAFPLFADWIGTGLRNRFWKIV